MTPLHYAAWNGHLEMSSIILAKIKDKNPKDNENQTPLHFAAINGHLDICKILMKEVEDKNPRNHNVQKST